MNLNLSSLSYRIIIVSCLSLLTVISAYSQDLEEVNVRSNTQSKTIKIDTPILSESPSSQSITTSVQAPSQVNRRDPDTYRKQVYIQTMLRQTYYHRLTTSPWSRYLKPKGWSENVMKWRHWSHLKSYLTGGEQDIIILREPEERVAVSTPTVADQPEISSTTLQDKDTSTSTNLDEITQPPSTAETYAELSIQTSDSVQAEESLLPLDEIATYDIVSRAPWLKEKAYYDQLKAEREALAAADITEEEQEEIEVPTEELMVSEPIVVQQPSPSPVQEASVQEPSVQENPITTPSPSLTQPPVVAEPSLPVTSPSFSSSLAPAAFASLKGNVPWPVKGRITDRFGVRENAEVRGLSPYNYGIDMICSEASLVKAVHSGTVLLARRQSPYDVIVTIKHGEYTTAYYYLITPYVKQGDVVQAGQNIGQLRTSVDEADFHFEIWHNQERLNPELWLK